MKALSIKRLGDWDRPWFPWQPPLLRCSVRYKLLYLGCHDNHCYWGLWATSSCTLVALKTIIAGLLCEVQAPVPRLPWQPLSLGCVRYELLYPCCMATIPTGLLEVQAPVSQLTRQPLLLDCSVRYKLLSLLVGGSRDLSPVVSLGIFSEATEGTMCSGVNSASKNEYQETPGGKDGRCVRVTTLTPS